MTTNDPIADMLTRIRNANTAKHDTVDIPSSKMKLALRISWLTKVMLRNMIWWITETSRTSVSP